MSSKPSSKTWVCVHGCELTKTPCKHLEELLPSANYLGEFERRSRYAGSKVDRVLPPIADRADEKARFIARVGDGLTPIEVDILVLKYVYNESNEDIAKELKLLSPETVARLHDEALKKLRERLLSPETVARFHDEALKKLRERMKK